MKCPVDGATLVMTERSGVEIDYCPQCRGVWLDRGELDKIVERATPPVALQEPPREVRREEHRNPPRGDDPRRPGDDLRRYGDDDRRRYGDDDDYRKKKRKSLLGDIFDF
jgi:Zn-finger nucleic acid-binding protein